MNKRILIVGGSSFIGINLIDSLINRGFEVIVYGRKKPLCLNHKFRFISAELTEFDLHRKSLSELDIHTVIYLVNSFSVNSKTSNFNDLLEINKNFISNVLDVVKRFVFFSSGGRVYRSSDLPHSENEELSALCDYGRSKILLESFISFESELKGKPYLIVRPSNPYGPYQMLNGTQGLIAVVTGRISSGQSVEIWGDGYEVRDYIYIDDFVDLFIKLLALPSPKYNIYNIGSGFPVSTLEILEVVKRNLKAYHVSVQYVSSLNTIKSNILNNSRLHDEVGYFDYTSLDLGVSKFIQWLGK